MPKHDPVPLEAIEEHLRENVRLGRMIEVEPGKFQLTPAGIAHVGSMMVRNKGGDGEP